VGGSEKRPRVGQFLIGGDTVGIFELYEKFKDRLSDLVVIRLHGMDREGN
jgi:hypothetical protein